MKKVLFILLMPLTLAAQPGTKGKTKPVKPKVAPVVKAAKELVVTADLKNLAENAAVSLMASDGSGNILGGALAKKGKFVIKAKLPEVGVYLLQLPNQQMIPLFVDNEAITVTGDATMLDEVKVKGSVVHDEFMEYSTLIQPLLTKDNELNAQAAASGVTDSLRIVYSANITKILTTADDFIGRKPASPVSALLLLVIKNRNYLPAGDYLELRYSRLQPKAQQSMFGKRIASDINEVKYGPNPIGSVAPDFSQNDTTGAPISLSSFKGKYVLVDFWASWCRPCREENPNVVENFNRFKDKNFTVLGVSLDRSKDPWIQAIADDKLTWTHVSDLKFWSNAVAQLYKVSSIPQNFLVGPDGKIIAKNLRGPALENTLCQFLGCN